MGENQLSWNENRGSNELSGISKKKSFARDRSARLISETLLLERGGLEPNLKNNYCSQSLFQYFSIFIPESVSPELPLNKDVIDPRLVFCFTTQRIVFTPGLFSYVKDEILSASENVFVHNTIMGPTSKSCSVLVMERKWLLPFHFHGRWNIFFRAEGRALENIAARKRHPPHAEGKRIGCQLPRVIWRRRRLRRNSPFKWHSQIKIITAVA